MLSWLAVLLVCVPVGVLAVVVCVVSGVFWVLVVSVGVVVAEDDRQFPLMSVYPDRHCLHCPAVSWKLGLQTTQR